MLWVWLIWWRYILWVLFLGIVLIGSLVGIGVWSASALTLDEAGVIVRWAGCDAQVFLVEGVGSLGGGFGVDLWFGVVFVVLLVPRDIPDPALVHILLHEAAHCRQLQEGSLLSMTPLEREQEADRMAVGWGCELGISPRWAAWIFSWLDRNDAYYGDPEHGTAASRVAQALWVADGLESCRFLSRAGGR